ncbi:MAG: hypothetical protein JWL59_3658 [Chthoniobacteraceae bacterium]|nr:hypothetical protein [Chthoniobacteraceae bacterium]
MKQFIIASALILTSSLAQAALGDDPEKSNNRYGEQIISQVDIYNGQNEERIYEKSDHRTAVIFNRQMAAVSVHYYNLNGKKQLSDSQIKEFLLLNGTDWKLEKPKLGTAMDVVKVTKWTAPDGKMAVLERSPKEDNLRIASAERLKELAGKTTSIR